MQPIVGSTDNVSLKKASEESDGVCTCNCHKEETDKKHVCNQETQTEPETTSEEQREIDLMTSGEFYIFHKACRL